MPFLKSTAKYHFCFQLPNTRKGYRDVSKTFSRFVFKAKTHFERCVPVIFLYIFLIFFIFFNRFLGFSGPIFKIMCIICKDYLFFVMVTCINSMTPPQRTRAIKQKRNYYDVLLFISFSEMLKTKHSEPWEVGKILGKP